VETVNSVFSPSAEEIAFSQKVVQAEAQAQERSVGAFLVDGKMIDKPFVDRARRILSIAQQQGMVDK
jgi:citrate lyase subunit beta/citryl-CoA lyase